MNPATASVSDKISALLLKKGVISKDQLSVAIKQQQMASEHVELGDILVELGFITNTVYFEVLNESSGVKSSDLSNTTFDWDLVHKIPKNIALQHKIVPLSMKEDVLEIATTDVYNLIAFDQIKRYFDKNIKITPLHTDEKKLLEALDMCYQYDMSIDGILNEIEQEKIGGNTVAWEHDGYINPTVRLIDVLISDAMKKGASDMHFEPQSNFVRLRYRIDGTLALIVTFHKDYWPAIVVRIKIMAGLNIAETRSAQDGRISCSILGKDVDLRVSSQPTIDGENIVIRILDRSKALMMIEELGLSSHNKDILLKSISRPYGIIIITGPTGCGKTTTLYSLLSHLNKPTVNIMTLEDPVEYKLPMIRQTGINEAANMTFANGIRSILRQDPDIIMLGEVRDADTAGMAVRAAMTGHQVLSTLHTNDAFGAIPRLFDLGVNPMMLSGLLTCIIAQRLVRKLCMHCKLEYSATDEDRTILKLPISKKQVLYRPVGCAHCNLTGYKGRIGVHEILYVDHELDDMIVRNEYRKNMIKYAINNGFKTMSYDGVQKVLAGLTDLSEMMASVDFINNGHDAAL